MLCRDDKRWMPSQDSIQKICSAFEPDSYNISGEYQVSMHQLREEEHPLLKHLFLKVLLETGFVARYPNNICRTYGTTYGFRIDEAPYVNSNVCRVHVILYIRGGERRSTSRILYRATSGFVSGSALWHPNNQVERTAVD